jgi:hypothetical protein
MMTLFPFLNSYTVVAASNDFNVNGSRQIPPARRPFN